MHRMGFPKIPVVNRYLGQPGVALNIGSVSHQLRTLDEVFRTGRVTSRPFHSLIPPPNSRFRPNDPTFMGPWTEFKSLSGRLET
jgi:hypothetical protein